MNKFPVTLAEGYSVIGSERARLGASRQSQARHIYQRIVTHFLGKRGIPGKQLLLWVEMQARNEMRMDFHGSVRMSQHCLCPSIC